MNASQQFSVAHVNYPWGDRFVVHHETDWIASVDSLDRALEMAAVLNRQAGSRPVDLPMREWWVDADPETGADD